MAGHSHWANIARKKGVKDARRGKLFSKLARRIIVCARQGGGDPDKNIALQFAIDEAKAGNMPNSTIENAVKKGAGLLDDPTDFEELVYEGYASGGVAILVEALTDNRNRTGPEVRKIFEKRGGTLGAPGSVAFKFEQVGLITLPKDAVDEDTLLLTAADAGATDVTPNDADGVWEVITPPEAFHAVKTALTDSGLTLDIAEITRIPQAPVDIAEAGQKKILSMMGELDDHDDVQKVYTDANITVDGD